MAYVEKESGTVCPNQQQRRRQQRRQWQGSNDDDLTLQTTAATTTKTTTTTAPICWSHLQASIAPAFPPVPAFPPQPLFGRETHGETTVVVTFQFLCQVLAILCPFFTGKSKIFFFPLIFESRQTTEMIKVKLRLEFQKTNTLVK